MYLRDYRKAEKEPPLMDHWPTDDAPGVATIKPTNFGTFGIWWSDFPAMERRGGYSGPYPTVEAAEQGARDWGEYWQSPIRLVYEGIDNRNA